MPNWLKKILGIKDDPKPEVISSAPTSPVEEKKEEPRKPVPWYVAALRWKGKKETDPELRKHLIPLWKRVGLSIDTLSGSLAAWCGLAAASTLIVVGLNYPSSGGRAMDWDKFGVAIDYHKNGIPQGAFVRLNHGGDCKSTKGNHVSQANGDCAPGDIVEMKKDVNGVYQSTGKFKKGATIDLYGGNQGDTWKVTTYSVTEICSVRWPADYTAPQAVTKSVKCTSGSSGVESTR